MINWQTLIAELESRGWTRGALSDHCGIRYSTLCDIANGRSTEPRGNAAVRLCDLHRAGISPALSAPVARPLAGDAQQAA